MYINISSDMIILISLFLSIIIGLLIILKVFHYLSLSPVNVVTIPNGLISGIITIDDAEFYSDYISLNQMYLFLRKANLYSILNNNAAGNLTEVENIIKKMKDKAKDFIKSDEIWDRKDLIYLLNKTVSSEDEGRFICLLAGKSVGKSLVLKTLNTNKSFVVDLREDPNILTGLISVLKKRQMFTKEMKNALMKIAMDVTTEFVSNQVGKSLEKFFEIISSRNNDPKILKALILELIQSFGHITLIIDEANIALTISDSSSKEDIKIIKDVLELFTLLTKQQKMLNVILVSSEHSFPSRLIDSRLGFNLEHLNGFIFVGEVPPNEMYKLLTEKWEIESNFALTLINIYGGHIWDIYQCLIRLEEMKNNNCWLLSSYLSKNVMLCLECKGQQINNKKRMRIILEKLAITGFVPLTISDDQFFKVLSEYGIGGVVSKSAIIFGLDPKVWELYPDAIEGIIPSKQSMRLIIAEVLIMEKSNKKF